MMGMEGYLLNIIRFYRVFKSLIVSGGHTHEKSIAQMFDEW